MWKSPGFALQNSRDVSPFNSVKGFLLGFHLMVLNSPISYLPVINGSFFFTFAKTKQVNVILNGFILYLLKKNTFHENHHISQFFGNNQSLSCVQLFATPWTVARQAPLSMGILPARIFEWFAMPSPKEIFPTHGLNQGLPHCRWILYRLSHQRGPRILGWVAFQFWV